MNTATNDKFIIAIDLGGTNLRVAMVSLDGRIIKRISTPTRSHEGPQAVIDRMVEKVNELIGDEGIRQATALAVAAPGPTDPWKGVIIEAPNMPGWQQVPLKRLLESRLNLATFLGNDANVAALGEHRYGEGRGSKHMIYVTVSTGIGGGVIVDGKLLLGKNGGAAEIGHMTIDINGPRCACGNIGCLEAIASGTSIARQAVERLTSGAKSTMLEAVDGDLSRINAEVVVQEAGRGDALALELMDRAATALGVGMVNLAHLFDPQTIVIGGGVSNAGPLLFDRVRQVVNERTMAIAADGIRIVPTSLGDDVGLLGAAALALDELGIA